MRLLRMETDLVHLFRWLLTRFTIIRLLGR